MKRSHFLLFLLIIACGTPHAKMADKRKMIAKKHQNISVFDTTTHTIHVMVALCDNEFQGIVPVPPKIGNGKDPDNNLYWGCGYGVRTYFQKSEEWEFLKSQKLDSIKLERLIFRHLERDDYYLVADAYNGEYIATCTQDFLYACAGQEKDTLHIGGKIIGIQGNAKLLSYIGHDGLMEFSLDEKFKNVDGKKRDCIILACISQKYFAPYLKPTKANPLVWTTGLMCPEAYTLHDALAAYIRNEPPETIRKKAALAYHKYQKCGENAALNLLVRGY